MGTRSIVAYDLTGDAKGRYVHWDGYPSYLGVQLQRIVARDGLRRAIETLTQEHYGWSSLDANLSVTKPLGSGYDDGRFVNVVGYGVAYTTHRGQSHEDDWIREGDNSWCEYAYVMTVEGIIVHRVTYDGMWEVLGAVAWQDEEGMSSLENDF